MIHNTRGTYQYFFSDATVVAIVQSAHGSWPAGLPKKDGAHALSGAGSVDTATTRLSKTSRTKNLIIEYKGRALPLAWRVRQGPTGPVPEALPIALIELMRTVVPAGATVVFLGDGECDGTTRQATLTEAGWS